MARIEPSFLQSFFQMGSTKEQEKGEAEINVCSKHLTMIDAKVMFCCRMYILVHLLPYIKELLASFLRNPIARV